MVRAVWQDDNAKVFRVADTITESFPEDTRRSTPLQRLRHWEGIQQRRYLTNFVTVTVASAFMRSPIPRRGSLQVPLPSYIRVEWTEPVLSAKTNVVGRKYSRIPRAQASLLL